MEVKKTEVNNLVTLSDYLPSLRQAKHKNERRIYCLSTHNFCLNFVSGCVVVCEALPVVAE